MAIQKLGYKLSSEEHNSTDLIRYARLAEDLGYDFAAISDHFHPWIDKQGQSPFVWSVLGGISQATEKLKVLTGVTCPTMRTHPAVIAHAAATAAQMMPGRFSLGVGTGENLNEHIIGEGWPRAGTRLEMLDEAIDVIRELWEGKNTNHDGAHFTVENARLYTLPDELPPIVVAASGDNALKLAAEKGDGLISLAPEAEVLETFSKAGGSGPRYCEVNVCWAATEEAAVKTAKEWWPVAGVKGELMQELPLPRHFEQAAGMVHEDDLTETVACGPDPEKHLASIRKFVDAGYDHIWIHQIGPDQQGFFDFYTNEVIPKL